MADYLRCEECGALIDDDTDVATCDCGYPVDSMFPAEPKYRSKKARLLAAIEKYRSLNPGPFTTESVALWSFGNGLYPTPARDCSKAEAIEWERKLEQSTK